MATAAGIASNKRVRVGMEASGHARWFERLLAELNFELWIGDAAEIDRKRERKQKTDRQDAQHILRLLLKDDFPRIWVPSWENRDLRQLLWHRHQRGTAMISRVEVERFSLTSSRSFDEVLAAINDTVGHPEMAEFWSSTQQARTVGELENSIQKANSQHG
jgi:hypothetical protein